MFFPIVPLLWELLVSSFLGVPAFVIIIIANPPNFLAAQNAGGNLGHEVF